MHMSFIRSGIVVVLVCLLANCTTTEIAGEPSIETVPHTAPQWQQHLKQLQKITHYQAHGQLGYISAKERFSTQFNWQYFDDHNYKLYLSSGLTRKTLTLQMTPNGLQISDDKGNMRTATNTYSLLKETIGMDFPIELFNYWLKGEPKGTDTYTIRGKDYLLTKFEYNLNGQTWQVNYGTYQHNQLPSLPENILIKGNDQTLKIRIDQWKL